MTDFTVFGAGGYLGRHLVAHLAGLGHAVRPVTRENWPAPGTALGHAIYAIGMTADFRGRPLETARAHGTHLCEALGRYAYESFLYLSSTRVYRGAPSTGEDTALTLRPADPDEVYNATKLAGESVCLAMPNPAVRVARLANIFGGEGASASFLAAVLDEARATKSVRFRTAPGSAKDFLAVDTACAALIRIAEGGRHRLYNVASGTNVRNEEIARILACTGIDVSFMPGAPEIVFPPIAVGRLAEEFGLHAPPFAARFAALLQRFSGDRT